MAKSERQKNELLARTLKGRNQVYYALIYMTDHLQFYASISPSPFFRLQCSEILSLHFFCFWVICLEGSLKFLVTKWQPSLMIEHYQLGNDDASLVLICFSNWYWIWVELGHTILRDTSYYLLFNHSTIRCHGIRLLTLHPVIWSKIKPRALLGVAWGFSGFLGVEPQVNPE